MKVLGLHKDPWHDTGAAVITHDGSQTHVFSLAEERCNREKHSRRFPTRALDACMRAAGVRDIREFDAVVVDYIANSDWRRDALHTPGETRTPLHQVDPERVICVNHHLAHASAAFYSSPFSEAAVLVLDGRGSDGETQSLFLAGPSGIELLDRSDRIGIGLLYAAVTQAIGFGLLQEGKTMGLAPYGREDTRPLLQFRRRLDGITLDYEGTCVQGTYELPGLPPLTSFEDRARAAFQVQEECENVLLSMARWVRERTGARNLCLSGGVALNSVANYKLLRSGIFDDVFVNPAASDPGIPLGCALYGLHRVLEIEKDYRTISPYLGPSYDADDIDRAVSKFSGFQVVEDGVLDAAADLLQENRIVGWFQGRSETGPRALGNRSLLMNPSRAENRDYLNEHVKHREWFRPFAPACLAEKAHEWFEIDRPVPYMLFVPPVRSEQQSRIPAVVHVDGTARLQTVAAHENKPFYELLRAFEERSGIPILLNTSFNVAGEPIVETPADAIRCFLSNQIDALVLGDILLVKSAILVP